MWRLRRNFNFVCVCGSLIAVSFTDLNSLPSLLTLSKPHSPHAHTRSLLTSSAATHLRTQKTKQHSVRTAVSTHLSSPLCPTPRDVDGTLSALYI